MKVDVSRILSLVIVKLAPALEGTYALDGNNELQVKRLAEWLAVGKQKGYNWKSTYSEIYQRWRARRP